MQDSRQSYLLGRGAATTGRSQQNDDSKRITQPSQRGKDALQEAAISESKAANLLKGVRGERPSDIEALVENLLRLSQLMIDFPEIDGVDVNPVKVFEKRAVALDTRIVLNASKHEE